jgi:hypothetical protein
MVSCRTLFPSSPLADAEALGGGEPPKRGRVDERVKEHEIRLFEIRNGALRPEVWITGSRSDERDLRRIRGLGSGILAFAPISSRTAH